LQHRHGDRRSPRDAGWLGAVAGHRTLAHGVEHFGQTGTIGDLYRHFRIDRDALAETVSGRLRSRCANDVYANDEGISDASGTKMKHRRSIR
jgi:pyruvate dehydrogenase complex dehydrogenase (E1) component